MKRLVAMCFPVAARQRLAEEKAQLLECIGVELVKRLLDDSDPIEVRLECDSNLVVGQLNDGSSHQSLATLAKWLSSDSPSVRSSCWLLLDKRRGPIHALTDGKLLYDDLAGGLE